MMPFVDTEYFTIGFNLLVIGFVLVAVLRAFLKTGKAIQEQSQKRIGLVDLINQELPQTQCGHCGHAGCLPYARAIAAGESINKCVPGGKNAIRRLSRLLNQTRESVDPAHGVPGPRMVAVIREDECIGCTKCIQACPVDAILGAAKVMHTVIEDECTGCDLCIEPCPVDCIDLLPAPLHFAALPSQPVVVINT